MMPMLLQLLFYTLYSCFILPNMRAADETLLRVVEYSSFGIAGYFIIIELVKVIGVFY